jgi:hypothetical protein
MRILLLTALLVCSLLPARSQTMIAGPFSAASMATFFKMMDGASDADGTEQPKDGLLSLQELAAIPNATELMKALDRNGDGMLNPVSELAIGLHRGQATMQMDRNLALRFLVGLDKNLDGYLRRNEISGLSDELIERLDNYGAAKYGKWSNAKAYDEYGKLKQTGPIQPDRRISVAELANAMADGIVVLGNGLYLK